MPRQARRVSNNGIYHIILRGNNQQQIFEDPDDYLKFIEILKECKKISEYQIFAFCLMGNHIHLLIKPTKENLEKILKRIGIRYVYWYNRKYNRVGHLFQDRFKSESVDADRYFLTVLRYIHQNPVKAGISNINYKFSSYNDYIRMTHEELTDVDFLFDMINRKNFIAFNNVLNDDACMEYKSQNFRMNDEKAKEIITDISGIKTLNEFQALDATKRDENMQLLKNYGFPIKQICRLTGISRGVIQRA